MIVVRNVFRLKFGQAKPALAVMKDGESLMKKLNFPPTRVLTDLIGPAYRVVLETSHENLGAYESDSKRVLGNPEWRSWYEKFIPYCEESYREVLTIVEQ